MTTAPDNSGLRAIVVVPENADHPTQPTCRLLRDLGHEVIPVISPDEAVQALSAGGADLLVVDLASAEQKRRLFERLSALPRESRPRRVAVFADEVDDYARTVHRQQDNPRVHVFLKPLHVHGLLTLLRSLEGRQLATA